MLPKPNLRVIALTQLLLIALLSACATPPAPLPPVVVPPPEIPALPQAARQPPTPPWCLPTCSDGWRREVESWQRSLMSVASPAEPASAPATR